MSEDDEKDKTHVPSTVCSATTEDHTEIRILKLKLQVQTKEIYVVKL